MWLNNESQKALFEKVERSSGSENTMEGVK
jgi:hypothetical protein